MHALRKLVTLGVVVVVASAVAGTVSAQTNSEVGTWKLNLAKSTFSPGPAPKSETVIVAATGQGVKISIEGVNAGRRHGGRCACRVASSWGTRACVGLPG